MQTFKIVILLLALGISQAQAGEDAPSALKQLADAGGDNGGLQPSIHWKSRMAARIKATLPPLRISLIGDSLSTRFHITGFLGIATIGSTWKAQWADQGGGNWFLDTNDSAASIYSL